MSCTASSDRPATVAASAPPAAVEAVQKEVGSEPERGGVRSGAALYADDADALGRGRGLFRALCTGYCHTTRGANRVAPDLFDCTYGHGGSDEDIFAVVSNGVPETQMLGFGGKLAEDDLWKIVAFVLSRSTCE